MLKFVCKIIVAGGDASRMARAGAEPMTCHPKPNAMLDASGGLVSGPGTTMCTTANQHAKVPGSSLPLFVTTHPLRFSRCAVAPHQMPKVLQNVKQPGLLYNPQAGFSPGCTASH